MCAAAQSPGIIDLIPGVRTLMIEYDPLVLPPGQLLAVLDAADKALPASKDVRLPSRVVHLPMAFDDAGTAATIQR